MLENATHKHAHKKRGYGCEQLGNVATRSVYPIVPFLPVSCLFEAAGRTGGEEGEESILMVLLKGSAKHG